MMWEVVYADGNANPLEENIIWRAAALGVSSQQRAQRAKLTGPSTWFAEISAVRTYDPQLSVTRSICRLILAGNLTAQAADKCNHANGARLLSKD
jgi:hypothetical protein